MLNFINQNPITRFAILILILLIEKIEGLLHVYILWGEEETLTHNYLKKAYHMAT